MYQVEQKPHPGLQLCMDRFRAGLGFTYNLLTPSGRNLVNERDDTVHIIAREQLLQLNGQAFRIMAEFFQLANQGFFLCVLWLVHRRTPCANRIIRIYKESSNGAHRASKSL